MTPVLKLIMQRLALGFVTLFILSTIIFSAVSFLPTDYAQSVLGMDATPETVEAFRREIGLDRPPFERYLNWVGSVAQGDLGISFASRVGSRREVIDIVMPRLENTLFLAGCTALIAVPLALALGLFTALYRNSIFDRVANTITLTNISFPDFFIAYALMLFFAVKFPLFHSLSNIHPGMSFWEQLQRSALPIATLTLVIGAHMMRMTRAAIIGVLASPYIEMARLKGISRISIIVAHALPNAWAPIVNVIAFNMAYLIVGVVVVEVIFVYPGIGQAMVDAVRSRDIPVVQACALIFAATYILLNLTADIISIATNPRLLHPR